MELLARALGPALPPALASVRVAWAWARYLLVDPLVLPVAGLVDVPVQAFLAHFATLSPRNQWAVVAALGVGGGWTACALALFAFLRGALRPDRNAAPLQPKRWLRRQQDELRARLRAEGTEAFPPLPALPNQASPFVIEYDSHLRDGEMRGWLWVVLGSDFDGNYFKTYPPPSQGPDAPARRWFVTLRMGEAPSPGPAARRGRRGPRASGDAPAGRRPLLLLSEHPPGEAAAARDRGQEPPSDVVVDLSGCRAGIYRDGAFRDAYLFGKRGPLVVSHPDRAILGSEKRLCLFAYNPALKEQWFRALQLLLDRHRLASLGVAPPDPAAPGGSPGAWTQPNGAPPDLDTLESDLSSWFLKYLSHLTDLHPGHFPQDGPEGGGGAARDPPAAPAAAPRHHGRSASVHFETPAAHPGTPQPAPVGPRGSVAGGRALPRRSHERFTFGLGRIPGVRRWFAAGGSVDGAAPAPPLGHAHTDGAALARAARSPDMPAPPAAHPGTGPPPSAAVTPRLNSLPGAEGASGLPAPARGGGAPRTPAGSGRFQRDVSMPELSSLRESAQSPPLSGQERSAEEAPLRGGHRDDEPGGGLPRTASLLGLDTSTGEALPRFPARSRGLDAVRLDALLAEGRQAAWTASPKQKGLIGRLVGAVASVERQYAAAERVLWGALGMSSGQPERRDTPRGSVGGARWRGRGSSSGASSSGARSAQSRERHSEAWESLGGSPAASRRGSRYGMAAAPSEAGSGEALSEEHLRMLDRELDNLWFGGDAPESAMEGQGDGRARHSQRTSLRASRVSYSTGPLPRASSANTLHVQHPPERRAPPPPPAPVPPAQLHERLERVRQEQGREPPPGPVPRGPSTSGAEALNLWAARMWFDIMRSERIETGLIRFFQRQLLRVPLPPYVGTLQLVHLKVGTVCPVFSNCEVLPSGGLKLRTRVRYKGDMQLAIETKLDLRETGAWSTFDRVLRVLHGQRVGPDGQLDLAMGPVAEGEEMSHGPEPEPEPAAAPSHHAVARLLGKVTSVLQGRPIRRIAANQARRIGNMLTTNIGKLPLSLSATLDRLEGDLVVWIPPPPTRRLWYGFEPSAQLELGCVPLVDGLPLKNRLVSRRIAAFFRKRLTHLIFANFVLPNCEGVDLPGLIPDPSDDLRTAAPAAPRTPPRPAAGAARERGGGRSRGTSDSEDDDSDMSDGPPMTPPVWTALPPFATATGGAAMDRRRPRRPRSDAGDGLGDGLEDGLGESSSGEGDPGGKEAGERDGAGWGGSGVMRGGLGLTPPGTSAQSRLSLQAGPGGSPLASRPRTRLSRASAAEGESWERGEMLHMARGGLKSAGSGGRPGPSSGSAAMKTPSHVTGAPPRQASLSRERAPQGSSGRPPSGRASPSVPVRRLEADLRTPPSDGAGRGAEPKTGSEGSSARGGRSRISGSGIWSSMVSLGSSMIGQSPSN